jgi:serine/threonine protein kinase/tetratricopeptide (TPR) repeat protein
MASRASGPDLLVGIELGHYRIVEKIGVGGMGEVYRARDEHLDRDVAIKILPARTLTDESARKHFHKEALILSQINHPNVATIHDLDTHQGVDFLVMEYIPGITLSAKVAGRPLPEKEVLRLGVELAEGLAAAHDHGIVHCDLKPSNLRITSDGRLKILDFGLAKLWRPVTASATTESLSETQAMAGTLPYMAPEQLLGEPIDARTDIHAAGAVLYEMATGQRPFAGVGSAQLIGAILHQVPVQPSVLNSRVSQELDRIILKCLEKSPEDRYQSAKEAAVDLRRLATPSSRVSAAVVRKKRSWRRKMTLAMCFGAVAFSLLGILLRIRRAHTLTERDTIVLSDFVNSTGDPVFDDTLKQAVLVQLEQSPFLNIVSEQRVQQTLRLMRRTPGERLTPELGRELCQRTGSQALLSGSVATLGSQYVIGLNVVNCDTGEYLATQQMQAKNKEDVLKALDSVTSGVRAKLGESLNSVRKFDVPIEEVTTPSLEALKAYSLGRRTLNEKGNLAAIPFFERATELDPNFATAYASLAAAQWNLNRSDRAEEAAERAYALRDRVSEPEKSRISALYYDTVLGDLDRSIPVYRLHAQIYPGSSWAHNNLASNLGELGRWQEAIAEVREALRLDPNNSFAYMNLTAFLIASNQPDAAEATIKQGLLLRALDDTSSRLPLYQLAFLRGNAREMERLLADMTGKDGEQESLDAQSNTEAYYGRLARARYFSRRAVESELRSGSQEAAALWRANAALREAEFGNPPLARQWIAAALAPRQSWVVKVLAALAFARIGDTVRARAIIQELEKNHPWNTRLRVYWLPTVRSAIEIRNGNSAQALAILDETVPYELGQPISQLATLYPAYLRGEAYLSVRDGAAAAVEFQKLLDYRGLVLNSPLGGLAYVGLARACALQGDTSGARKRYQTFFALWKDADLGVPIMKQVKSEYEKLK